MKAEFFSSDFHMFNWQYFISQSVLLVVDYSCALQKDILVQGRLYISREFVCFYANIFRWETIVCCDFLNVYILYICRIWYAVCAHHMTCHVCCCAHLCWSMT